MSVLLLIGYFTLTIVALTLLAIAGLTLVIVKERRKYKHVPGPPDVSFFSGNGKAVSDPKYSDGGRDQVFVRLGKEYGPLFKITGLHKVFLIATSPEIAKELLTKSKYLKSREVMEPLRVTFKETFFGDSIVTITDHKEWKLRRHALNPTFHRAFLSQLIPVFNLTADSMIKALDMKVESGDPVSLLDVFGRATLDAICQIAFSFDFLKAENAGDRSLVADLKVSAEAFSTFSYNRLMALSFKHRAKVRAYREALRGVRQAMEAVLDERLDQLRRGKETPRDILAIMLEGMAGHCSKEDLVSEMVTMLEAGQETTAAVLSSLMLELGRQPEYEERLREEVLSVVGSDKASILAEDLDCLPWMTAVIKETLRLYSPASGTSRVIPEDMELGGFKVPKGAIVIVMFTAIHHIHHEDESNFRPEKWLPENEERSNFNFMPFSLGQRSCIGRQFAWMEAKILLAKFFQKFRFELDPSETFVMKEVLTLKPASGVIGRVFHA